MPKRTNYKPVKKTQDYPEPVLDRHLTKLGFTFKMRIWMKDGVTVSFDRWLWRISKAGYETKEIRTMSELYEKYWEFTGKVLPPIETIETI